MTDPGPLLKTRDVARILGVSARTAGGYLGRYAGTRNPFVPPYDYVAGRPVWLPSQESDIRAWQARRAGQGVGGGPKPTPEDPGILTELEHRAVRMTAELYNILCQITGADRSRYPDMGELVHHVHAIQRAILAQAAARVYPNLYRLLGEVLPTDDVRRMSE